MTLSITLPLWQFIVMACLSLIGLCCIIGAILIHFMDDEPKEKKLSREEKK